jgi:hypothetical protein
MRLVGSDPGEKPWPFARITPKLPIPRRKGYSRIMSSGDFIGILRLSALSALAPGLLLRPAR